MTIADSTQAPKITHKSSAHEEFSWLNESGQDFPNACFVENVLDICNGIRLCLSLASQSDNERQHNGMCNDDEEHLKVLPTLDPVDSGHMLRMALASSKLLAREAERTIEWINEYGERHLAGRVNNKQ